MKKYTLLCVGLCAAMAFTSCKSSESAYKKAYENYAKKDEKPLNIVAFKHKPRQHHFKHKRA